ncbi:PREDICTED: serine/arginine-rich SC35-like splicing factor SCL33 isoform X1 [Camelina sativa]|uniref:Serine/arginine-rich SC35-like splicing factor SCL33 isoform X1 n=1 Tax=Camelina sativa TaxID=90675 RepID=A0ABM0XJG3_CAMSA|nr:PREDICTED: serine/arginine-rich SC35-like splicing factor SCL33 isoform X1 [Camelina sativa]
MGRSYSYSPSPPRSYGRSYRSPSPVGYYRGRSRDPPTSLLVRNLRHDCRQNDLRRPFGRLGRLKDVYIPRNYYTGEPRGFGFVQYYDPADAADAKYHLDGYVLLGREITVVFAEENRKKPSEMRERSRAEHLQDLLAIHVHLNTEEAIRVHQTTEEASRVHHMMIGAIQDRFPGGIGRDHTQGQAQGLGMNQEAEARVPDTEGDML